MYARKFRKITIFGRNQQIAAAVALCLMVSALNIVAKAGERLIIQLKDFSQTEVKGAGFRLPVDGSLHINALGGGTEKSMPFSKTEMYAYGWIINADTRELVWRMDRSNTSRDHKDRKFDDQVSLPKGEYEVYFSAHGIASSTTFSTFDINIDRRKGDFEHRKNKHGFFGWFEDLFGDDLEREWQQRSKNWYIEISADEALATVSMFTVPKEFSYVLYKATKLGENEHIRQQFIVSRPLSIKVYSLGEMDRSNRLADYGWIVDAKTRKRVWEMQRSNCRRFGGVDKDVKCEEKINLSSGEYTIYYITDDSHSFVDWNGPPPYDPFNYGITLIASNEKDKENFKLTSTQREDKNIIVQLIRVGNDETRSANFSLKENTEVRIYALGEASTSRHQMADYGWIIDSRTREKVWTMDYDRTEDAGGVERNRMIDEVVNLPKGDYIVLYQTDDSHAYNSWNTSPPFDPEYWGITVSGAGDKFDLSKVEKNVVPSRTGIIAQIVQVGNDVNRVVSFKLDKPTHVRVYAIGESQNREMFDYGWIEREEDHGVVWEMTYSMTFHAGGGRKNRMVNTTILLDKGNYTLHYVSDDSHSYNDWNTEPPDDATMWGITLYAEQ